MTHKEKLSGLTSDEYEIFKERIWREVIDRYLLNESWEHAVPVAAETAIMGQVAMKVIDEILSRRMPPKVEFDWWRPEPNEGYSLIYAAGGVLSTHGDSHIYVNAGNVFPTAEAAEAESRRTAARRFYEHCCRQVNGGRLWPQVCVFDVVWIPDRIDIVRSVLLECAADVSIAAVASEADARAISAAMREKNLLQAYFGG